MTYYDAFTMQWADASPEEEREVIVYARKLETGDEFRCSSCLETVRQDWNGPRKRGYDLNVSILDDSGVSARCRGTVSLCDSCRASFDAADTACDERNGS